MIGRGKLSAYFNHFFNIYVICFWIGVSTFVVVSFFTQTIPRARYVILFMGASVHLFIYKEISESLEKNKRQDVILLSIIAMVVLFATIYMYQSFWDFYGGGVPVTYEYVIAAFFIASLCYLSIREFGYPIVIVYILTIFYTYIGGFLSGLFSHGGMSISRILKVSILNMSGFYGELPRLVAIWITFFILYGGLIWAYGFFDYVMPLMERLDKLTRSGIAQSAVVASLLMGSVNGSPTANSALTGSVTIPLMKERGLSGRSAAGIEATASTGGQIMPPVMGSVAFVMASIVGISYIEILRAGLIPAILFYIIVVLGVHFTVIRELSESSSTLSGVGGEGNNIGENIIDGMVFMVPFILLILLLGFLNWTVVTSAFVTASAQIFTGIGSPFLKKILSINDHWGFKSVLAETMEGFRIGGSLLAAIMILIAVIGGIVDLIRGTGITSKLSLAFLDITGGVLIIAAVAGLFLCILLGMGMPSIAAYSVVAILVAPMFVTGFGIEELVVHFYVFYAVILCFITPPIANAVVVTSNIAGSNFIKTCISAMKLSAPLFLFPIVILYHPVIITGSILVPDVLLTVSKVTIGAIGITYGINHPAADLPRIAELLARLLFVCLGTFLMLYPSSSMLYIFSYFSLAVIYLYNKSINMPESRLMRILS